MQVTGTPAAEAVIARMHELRSGELTITIGTGCCESTAPFLYEDFWPGPDQEVVGAVADVAVFAPEYLRNLYPDADGVVVDVVHDVSAESLSIETELDCRLILRGTAADGTGPGGIDFGIDVGADVGADGTPGGASCAVPSRPTVTASSIVTGGPSRVVGEPPPSLRHLRMR